jgi:hypothetical protein
MRFRSITDDRAFLQVPCNLAHSAFAQHCATNLAFAPDSPFSSAPQRPPKSFGLCSSRKTARGPRPMDVLP